MKIIQDYWAGQGLFA